MTKWRMNFQYEFSLVTRALVSRHFFMWQWLKMSKRDACRS